MRFIGRRLRTNEDVKLQIFKSETEVSRKSYRLRQTSSICSVLIDLSLSVMVASTSGAWRTSLVQNSQAPPSFSRKSWVESRKTRWQNVNIVLLCRSGCKNTLMQRWWTHWHQEWNSQVQKLAKILRSRTQSSIKPRTSQGSALYTSLTGLLNNVNRSTKPMVHNITCFSCFPT